METTITADVTGSLQVLIYVSVVLLLIIGVFLIKLLLDASNLVNSMQDFIKVTQTELEPTIKEFQGTLVNINSISSNVNRQINSLSDGIDKGGRIMTDSAEKAYKQLKTAGAYTKETLLSIISKLVKK